MELFAFLASFLWLSRTFTFRHTSVTCCCLGQPIGKSQKRACKEDSVGVRDSGSVEDGRGRRSRSGIKIRRGTIKAGEGSALSAFARRTVDKITLRARYVCGHCYQRRPGTCSVHETVRVRDKWKLWRTGGGVWNQTKASRTPFSSAHVWWFSISYD